MKIDIHVHTKKVKQGDATTRNVEAAKFAEIIKLTDVKILAITNHNHFDLDQYNAFKDRVDGICQIWPGVELDIEEESNHAHLIIIVDPAKAQEFSDLVENIMNGFTADNFRINLEDTVNTFDHLSPVYIVHYHSKRPYLLDHQVDKLMSLVNNSKKVLKEASNSISAGIYISHGHNSIYGSDIQDWNDYQEVSKKLPELRLPVESFEQFGLLLDKDDYTINTILNKKTKENIQLNPFQNTAELVNLDIYNDINIIFGSKGTGKTDILKALSKYYNDAGYNTLVYESNKLKIEKEYDLKGQYFSAAVTDYEIEECSDELTFIRNATEKSVTRLSEYFQYFLIEQTNKISKNLVVKDFSPLDGGNAERGFNDILNAEDQIFKFLEYVSDNKLLEDVVGNELIKELIEILVKILDKIEDETVDRFDKFKSIALFNSFIKTINLEIAKKTGQPEKPLKTGFKEYASNRIKIEFNLKKILTNISKTIEPNIEYVGDLGEKGKLYCQTNLVIQNGNFINVDYIPVSNNVTKNPQRFVAQKLGLIQNYLFSNELFEKIEELRTEENGNSITCLTDLLLFNGHFTVNSEEYEPSNGESSMVLLHNELSKDTDIYIIDEPEKSLGNDYISDVIVPLLKEHAQRGKKVIIATHDANIAVRTLPYNSIYRGHDSNGYFTFVGNPFSNNLKCITNDRDDLDWKIVSMKTLEGGQEAFGERGKIYGKV